MKTLFMKTILSLRYRIVWYLASLGTILCGIGFVGNLVVPKTIISTTRTSLAKGLHIISHSLIHVNERR